MTAELARQLNVQGVEVDIAILDNAGKGNDEIFSEVGDRAAATYRLPCDRQFDPKTVWALSRQIRQRRIDVVHSHSYKTTFYAGLLRPWLKFGLVSTYHNWLTHTRALRVYAALDKNLARFNDMSIGVSTPVVTELKRHVSEHKVAQIDNGIDVGAYLPTPDRTSAKRRLGLDPARQHVGFVGRLSPEKGLPDLLNAMHDARLRHMDLLIAGEGPERPALEAQVQALGLSSRVQFLGYRRDTQSIYDALDVFVLPSHLEAFPMVLLEAMSCALPVIATQVGEVPRMVATGKTGWVVPPGAVADLREALGEALGDPAGARARGQAARAVVVNQFSSQVMASRYLALYQRVTASV